MEVDIKAYLKRALPILFEILEGNDLADSAWKTINENYVRERERRIEKYKQDPKTQFEVNLYDVMISIAR